MAHYNLETITTITTIKIILTIKRRWKTIKEGRRREESNNER